MSRKRPSPFNFIKSKKVCNTSQDAEKFKKLGIDPVWEINTAQMSIRLLFDSEKFQAKLPPIIMKHQLYSIIPRRTEVDKFLNSKQENGEIRMFKLGVEEDEIGVILKTDLVKYLQVACKENSVVEKFLDRVILKSMDVYYTHDVLKNGFNVSKEDLSELVQQGLLTHRQVGSWWLSIPYAGEFVRALTEGRKAILQTLRRCKYKEILQHELETRSYSKTEKLGMKYHIHDIIGADLVTCVKVESGTLLRLKD